MPRIQALTARQIIDSRGYPTVEATLTLDSGIHATSSVPSGNVANSLEAYELRDHDPQAFFGLGVSKAVANVKGPIQEAVVGLDPLYQTQLDQTLVNLDGTPNKSKLGANAILAVSQAALKAAAASLGLPTFVYIKEKYQMISQYRLPTPIFNLMNGGRHGSSTLDFQEFQLVPASHLPYTKAVQIGVEMFMALERILEQKGAIRAVGVEGGFSPNLATNIDALEIFSETIRLTPYNLAQDAFIGIDVSPSDFYKNGKYLIKDKSQPLDAKAMVKFYQDLHNQYRVFSFEDPFHPDAWSDWKYLTAEMGETAMIMADDIVATNKTLLMKAIQEQICNALVIKPNRVGTVTETIEIVQIAKQAGWHTIMSHRSGETTDDFLADLAVGIGTDYVKFGAPSRGERVVKYNRLLRIAEILQRESITPQTTPGEPHMDQTLPAPTPAPNPAPVTTPAPITTTATPPVTPATPLAAIQPIPDSFDTNLNSAQLTPTPVPGLAPAIPPVTPAPAPTAVVPPATVQVTPSPVTTEPDRTVTETTPQAPLTPPELNTPTPAPGATPARPIMPIGSGLAAIQQSSTPENTKDNQLPETSYPAAVPPMATETTPPPTAQLTPIPVLHVDTKTEANAFSSSTNPDLNDIQQNLNQLAGLVTPNAAIAPPTSTTTGLRPPTPPTFGSPTTSADQG